MLVAPEVEGLYCTLDRVVREVTAEDRRAEFHYTRDSTAVIEPWAKSEGRRPRWESDKVCRTTRDDLEGESQGKRSCLDAVVLHVSNEPITRDPDYGWR